MPRLDKNPIRQCIVTGEQGEKEQLIRFVVGPENRVVPDLAGKLPGRGMWVLAHRDTVEQAVKKQAFSRAAKQKVIAEATLPEKVGELLNHRAVQAVSMARKAGEMVSGFEKIRQALDSGTVIALIHAQDAGVDGIRKLRADKDIPVFMLSRDVMARIATRENVAHMALCKGRASGQCLKDLQRFAGFIEKTSL